MRVLRAALVVVFSGTFFVGQAQNQLVLLSRERVLARYTEGQAISYKLKKSKKFVVGYIVQIDDFSFVTTNDTIPFSSVAEIGLKTHYHATKLFGSLILAAGILYFTIDEANSALVHGEGYDNDKAVWLPAAIMVTTGGILKMIRKRSEHIRYPVKLLAAPKGSGFWRPE